MRKIISYLLLLVMSATLLSSCSNNTDNDVAVDSENTETSSDEKIQLQVWSHFSGMNDVIRGFENKYPNIEVNIVPFNYAEYEMAYKSSLLLEEGKADVFIIDSNEYGNFNSIEGLENLLKPEYGVSKYKEKFDPDLWDLGLSLDKQELLGLPIASAPIVTYYREDIMKKYGFPSDPDELATYMSDSSNWLNMARKLKEDDIYIFQWYSEIVKVATASMPYFNEELEYMRDNDEFKAALEIAIEAKKDNLALLSDIWSASGEEALQQGKLAMVYLGSWGTNQLKEWTPELEGKWRVTKLPFGVAGWNNSTILSMAANSNKKDAAWKFIEYYTFEYNEKDRIGNVSGYLDFRDLERYTGEGNLFLGGQKEQTLYENVMTEVKEYPVTPLDKKAFNIWDLAVREGLDRDQSVDQIMKNIREQINSQLNEEINILKKLQ